jgi:hypothetical protein
MRLCNCDFGGWFRRFAIDRGGGAVRQRVISGGFASRSLGLSDSVDFDVIFLRRMV